MSGGSSTDPYGKLLTKVKEYSRSRRLGGEARKGKQAVDLNAFQDTTAWGDESQEQERLKDLRQYLLEFGREWNLQLDSLADVMSDGPSRARIIIIRTSFQQEANARRMHEPGLRRILMSVGIVGSVGSVKLRTWRMLTDPTLEY